MDQENKISEMANTAQAPQERKLPLARPGRAAWLKKTGRRLHIIRTGMVVIGSLVLILGLLLVILPAFRVQEILVEGDTGITLPEQIIAASGIEIGDEIVGLDLDGAISGIGKNCPLVWVETVSVNLKTVKIQVKSRASMYTEYADRYFSLDRNLCVLAVSDNAECFAGLLRVDLPNIASVTVGQEISFCNAETDRSYIATMLELLEELELTDRVDLLDVSEKYQVSFVVDGTHQILLGKVSDLTLKLELAEQIMSVKQGSSPCAVVDVSNPKQSTYRPVESLG